MRPASGSGNVGRAGGLRLAGAGWRGRRRGTEATGVRCGASCHGSANGRGDGNSRAPGGAAPCDGDVCGDGSGGRDARRAPWVQRLRRPRPGRRRRVHRLTPTPAETAAPSPVAYSDAGRYGRAESLTDTHGFRAAGTDAGRALADELRGIVQEGDPAGVSRVSGG